MVLLIEEGGSPSLFFLEQELHGSEDKLDKGSGKESTHNGWYYRKTTPEL